MKKISIIIPVLNEAENVSELQKYLKIYFPNTEIIFSDGGSTDGTLEQIDSDSILLHSRQGRGVQMNEGAEIASGTIFWFLHADCRPHSLSISAIETALKDSSVLGGAFEYNLNHPNIYFRLTEFFSNTKNRIFKLFFGDMGIFVRAETFRALEGYREIPIMEDIDFCIRLKKKGDIVILPYRIETSTRRWETEGILWNVVRNWVLQLAWSMGVSPYRLKRWYSFSNNKET